MWNVWYKKKQTNISNQPISAGASDKIICHILILCSVYCHWKKGTSSLSFSPIGKSLVFLPQTCPFEVSSLSEQAQLQGDLPHGLLSLP